VSSFLLAVNRPGKDAGADFVRVSAWGGQAESCNTYLSKGKKVAVEGRIRTSRKENEDGSYTNYFEINANRVEFLSPREDSEQSGVQAEAAPAAEPTAEAQPQTDDIPF
jgi:single-strand DNA-binding protein